MNFYGHAVFAARLSTDRGFVLGSMLPDFEGMSGTRLVATSHDGIRDGVALHHATDSVFHGAPEFLELCSGGLAALTELGIPRATARAVAHVGTELVFDSYLIASHGEEREYVASLESAHPGELGPSMEFTDGGGRFEALRRRLVEFGVPRAYDDAGFVADRLVNALASRPRLAMRDGERDRVADWVAAARPRILGIAGALERRVADALNVSRTPVRADGPLPADRRPQRDA